MSLDSWALRNQFTLKHSVDSNASVIAERYWLSPCEAFLEENVLKVGADEAVLDRIAIVIEGLHHVCTPTFAQPEGSAEKDLIVLDQAQDDLQALFLELEGPHHWRHHHVILLKTTPTNEVIVLVGTQQILLLLRIIIIFLKLHPTTSKIMMILGTSTTWRRHLRVLLGYRYVLLTHIVSTVDAIRLNQTSVVHVPHCSSSKSIIIIIFMLHHLDLLLLLLTGAGIVVSPVLGP